MTLEVVNVFVYARQRCVFGKEASRGIVYKIKCKDCDSVGQTSRVLKTRVKENAKAIVTLDENFLLAKHHMLHSHEIDLENVEIVDKSPTWQVKDSFLKRGIPCEIKTL